MNRVFNKAFLAAALFGIATSAFASTAVAGGEAGMEEHSMAVHYGDLNLDSAAGQETLKRRLSYAARVVCPNAYARDLDTRNAGKQCIRQALDEANATIAQRQYARAAGAKGNAITVKGSAAPVRGNRT